MRALSLARSVSGPFRSSRVLQDVASDGVFMLTNLFTRLLWRRDPISDRRAVDRLPGAENDDVPEQHQTVVWCAADYEHVVESE